MKVEMAIIRKHDRDTRALKPFLVDDRWADRIEKVSRGKIMRVPSDAPKRGRGRPRKPRPEA